ncbi:Gfo/Idh/MocA family oxidoreductase [Kibdelosporangium phytohabitans]|uniref:Oxidoreductase n=1 Tax=Kibdelosporangium phytohabitans TaxID=860235 RepID=A0A0N9I2S7_9PSEU|nr:Gfo/Idh/MocA family oxidoreductase [Kibdelosporangium phytohabitans]ALG08528.1 oxidoreductase [Kibdelosporangium phytohabitans]MBE1470400.1 putative dehydrogenase [Kibdelosporangium phytohabitans]
MRSLVVGLGRAGAGLHLPVLAKARAGVAHLFDDTDIVACDPQVDMTGRPGLRVVRSVREASGILDPATTVTHICTPPTERFQVIAELAELGFRKLIVEKPLAADNDDLARIIRLRRKHALHIEVVEPWLTSTLTGRLGEVIRHGKFGALKSIAIAQNEPRFRRSLKSPDHPTAFDVELPHGIALALRLVGAARVTHASGYDLAVGDVVVPRMGGACVGLRHNLGARTEISSDLTSPVRERRITMHFENGLAVGHFAVSDDDDYSQLTLSTNGVRTHEVIRDDSMTEWMTQAYRKFHAAVEHAKGFTFAAEVVQLLSVAKNICAEPVMPSTRASADPAPSRVG